MTRRNFVIGSLAALVLGASWAKSAEKTAEKGDKLPPGLEPVTHTDEEWRKLLSPEQYAVLRHEATEPPGSSPLNAEKREGRFVCAGCDLDLFTSKMKFESGTGWPSFFTTIPGHVATKTDYKILLPRTEYHCVRCGGHQGHVFDDGPAPTGKRFCNTGVSLKFVPGKLA